LIELSYNWQIEGTRDESNGNQQITMQLGNLELEEHQPNGFETVLNLPSNSIFWMPPVMRCTSTPDKLISVDLGKIPASKFAKIGDASSEVEFTMRWIGCYDKTTQHQLYDANLKLHTVDYPAYAMSMQMDFTPIANNEALMANTIDKDKGGATGLALEVTDKTTQATISNGVPFDLESAYSTGSTARTFAARLKSTAAKVTPGQFKSIATYTVTYK
jgi:type 1 fimbria pilin